MQVCKADFTKKMQIDGKWGGKCQANRQRTRVCQNSESTQNTPKLPVGGYESVFKYSILRDLFLVLTHPQKGRSRPALNTGTMDKVGGEGGVYAP